MTTKDLMIGDYVTFKDCQNDDAPTIVKIEGLGYQGQGVVEEALVTIDGDEYGFDCVEIDEEFVGIPLTGEILESNGFRNIGGHWFDDNSDYYELEVEEYSDSIWRVIYHSTELNIGDERVFVSHVHELQHFLKHCGINKEIVL